jgi:hypothetical protein
LDHLLHGAITQRQDQHQHRQHQHQTAGGNQKSSAGVMIEVCIVSAVCVALVQYLIRNISEEFGQNFELDYCKKEL